MLVFSHGGLNAAPIEMALEAKARGLKVITVSSHANVKIARRSHSSGKVLSEVADVAIDNCVPPEDSLVDVGQLEKVAAGSTVAAVSIAMSLVAETASVLAKKGKVPPTFVSPNVHGVPKDHMAGVYRVLLQAAVHDKEALTPVVLFNMSRIIDEKDRFEQIQPSMAVKGGHGEGLRRPCGDQPEMSDRRGQPQASDGPRLRGWVSFSSLNLPGVLGLRSREGRESQAFLDRSGSKAFPHALLLTSRPSKALRRGGIL